MNAGRGLGYCYLSPAVQERFTPINAGWKAGRVPLESFFGPDDGPVADGVALRQLDQLARGDRQRGRALASFDDFGADAIFGRNRELAGHAARARSPRSAGRRSTCPRPTAAPSSRCRSATATRRSCSPS